MVSTSAAVVSKRYDVFMETPCTRRRRRSPDKAGSAMRVP
jgi:hypothetical protein